MPFGTFVLTANWAKFSKSGGLSGIRNRSVAHWLAESVGVGLESRPWARLALDPAPGLDLCGLGEWCECGLVLCGVGVGVGCGCGV